MGPDRAASCFSRPHTLIADDSRIVRASLSKHLSNLFNFSEAVDGEEAWQFLLRHESVDLLITDLTMPRLDGYSLLRRMRASRSEHLREMPVVVLSGTDDAEERREARAAGATDLIAKGMPPGQLLSRMTLLAQLVCAQRLYAGRPSAAPTLSPYAFQSAAERLLAHALQGRQDLALLSLSVAGDAGMSGRMLAELRRAIRQADLLACTGAAEFSVVTASADAATARGFAERLCDAARAVLAGDNHANTAGAVYCGVATLTEIATDPTAAPSLHALWDAARRTRLAGMARGGIGAVGAVGAIGAAEESAFAGK